MEEEKEEWEEEAGVETNLLRKMLNLFALSLLPSTAVQPDLQSVMVLIPFQASRISLACSFLSNFRLLESLAALMQSLSSPGALLISS